jgi:hypothetical protein
LEAYSATEDDKVANANVVRTIEQFFFNPKTETRELFDTFIVDKKRIETALSACENFIGELQKFKLRYTSEDADRNNLREALSQVRAYCESLEESLRGSDDPTVIDS